MFPLVLLFALSVFAVGIYLTATRNEHSILAAGCASVFAVLAVWCLALNQQTMRDQDVVRLDELLNPVNERLQQINVLLNLVSEQQLISERAKAVAFRENERDALRRAIREEILRKDYQAALVLAGEIERVFGYRNEADLFRQEIEVLQHEEIRRQVEGSMASIDRFCRSEQWNQALREAERVMKLFPGEPAAQRLPQDIEQRRADHKQRLLDAWNDAVTRHDVDGSIEILRQLDAYLTPAEAEAMQETARRVFKDKLQLMGQQFTICVRDHDWLQAVRLGDILMNEFPNSRMAQEVREKIDLLRQRASELLSASQTPTSQSATPVGT